MKQMSVDDNEQIKQLIKKKNQPISKRHEEFSALFIPKCWMQLQIMDRVHLLANLIYKCVCHPIM